MRMTFSVPCELWHNSWQIFTLISRCGSSLFTFQRNCWGGGDGDEGRDGGSHGKSWQAAHPEAGSCNLWKCVCVTFRNMLWSSLKMFVSQVSDLVELTKQQAVTIRRLERDSLAKSDRIADIETRWHWIWCSLVPSQHAMLLNPFVYNF